jgi:hypothetical protein
MVTIVNDRPRGEDVQRQDSVTGSWQASAAHGSNKAAAPPEASPSRMARILAQRRHACKP